SRTRSSNIAASQKWGGEKRINGPPPQPTLPAVRHAIISLIVPSSPQRGPYCRTRNGAEKQRKENCQTSAKDYKTHRVRSRNMRDWKAIVAKNVRKLRQQRKLTQEQLAFASKIDLTYLGGIERGRRNPSLMVMARIAEALGVALPRLLSD